MVYSNSGLNFCVRNVKTQGFQTEGAVGKMPRKLGFSIH